MQHLRDVRDQGRALAAQEQQKREDRLQFRREHPDTKRTPLQKIQDVVDDRFVRNEKLDEKIKRKKQELKNYKVTPVKSKPPEEDDEEIYESERAAYCGNTSRCLFLVLVFWGMVALFATIVMM
jgi:hypothetical protein